MLAAPWRGLHATTKPLHSQSTVLPNPHLEDQSLLPPVGHGELDLPVQAPWPQQGRVQRVRPAATSRHSSRGQGPGRSPDNL